MKNRPRSDNTATLSESISRRLSMYALAASAAGVGMLAWAQPAEAKIVYTPADKWLPLNQKFFLDLNHDGINDFRFELDSANWSTLFSRGFLRSLAVEVAQSSQSKNAFYYSVSQRDLCAPALRKGTKIGPKSPFTGPAGPWLFLRSDQSGVPHSACKWLGVKQAYLGVSFMIKGQAHYGWVRLGYMQASTNAPMRAKLTGYAYESIPNKPIIAGEIKNSEDENIAAPNSSLSTPTREPATLGALAVGAAGLFLWRREEQVGAGSQEN